MAKYDLEKQERVKNARSWLDRAIKEKAFIEMKKINLKSLEINNYFHLIVTYFAACLGCSVRYTREELVKRDICKSIFVQKRYSTKGGQEFLHVKGWADLDQTQAHAVVEMIHNFAAIECEIKLPKPEDLVYPEAQREVKAEIENAKHFLY